jgi:hypothetical protein
MIGYIKQTQENKINSPFSGVSGRIQDSLDPSEWLSFTNPPSQGISRFDSRTDNYLKKAIHDHESSLERERALWEYADRHRVESLSVLGKVALNDPDPSVRWSTLWAIQKFGGHQSVGIISRSLKDENPDVRDWANLLLFEVTGQQSIKDNRRFQFDSSNPFDQTLPLCIAGYARTLIPGLGLVQVTLSPKWFESIMGRVMACTLEETFDTDLVVEKRIRDYHPDGTDHYEIYKFSGFSQKITENIKYHTYEANVNHTFYPSGKVEVYDSEISPIENPAGSIQRIAATYTEPILGGPTSRIIRSVRGRYKGFAYVNIGKLLENNQNLELGEAMKVGPGEVQLASVNHRTVGKLANTFLYGSFKGKLSDLNNDGLLDVNTEKCHGTIGGLPDFNHDGIADGDPFDPFFNKIL